MPSEFSNWLLLTREQSRTGPSATMINEATKQSYILHRMVKGRPDNALIQGGRYITERIKLVNSGRFRTYKPGEKRTPGRVKTVESVSFPWRFTTNDFPYTDAEILLNMGSDPALAFKNFKKSMKQDLVTDHCNGMEDALWAVPDFAQMEDLQLIGGKLYSVPTFITETAKRSPYWGGGATLGQLNPDTYSNWDNQRRTYDSALPYGNAGIISAFDAMDLDLQWDSIPNFKEYSESDNLGRLMIVTTKAGRAMYSNALRIANDHTRAGPQDPSYGSPVWQGKPVTFSDVLGAAPISETAGVADNVPYPDAKPRYFFINGNYLYPIYHKEKWQDISDPINGGAERPDTDVIYMTSWYNLICVSRKRQGIIAPA